MGHRLEPSLTGDVGDPEAEVPTLRMLDGPRVGHVYVLTRRDVKIGDDEDCTIAVPEAGLAERHAMVFIGPGRPRLIDLVGEGTTVLNGRPVSSAELRDGDIVLLGQVVVARFEYRAVVRWESGHGPLDADVFRSLTLRERSVADLYARGMLPYVIAEMLDMPEADVEATVTGLRDRLGCSTRTALIAALCHAVPSGR